MAGIPKHTRNNFENTEHLLHEARAMLRAVEAMAEAANLPPSPETESMSVLIIATRNKLIEADRAHAAEWVGHGGNTSRLTPEEVATARGEAELEK